MRTDRVNSVEQHFADFESAWRSGRVPMISDYLVADQTPDLTMALLAELIAIDLEYRWRDDKRRKTDAVGEQPRMSAYVRVIDQLDSVNDLPAWLVAEEYRVRRLWGDRPKKDQFIAKYPEHLTVLVPLLCVIDDELAADGMAPSNKTDPPALQTNDIRTALPFSDFVLEQHLGTGGMGKVYRATQRSSGRKVAIKALLKSRQRSPTAVEQFIREADIVQQLDHPNIVRVHGLGRFPGGGHFLLLDFVDGVDLAARITSGTVAIADALRITCAVAEAVEYAHQHSVIHCDLKPSNVLLSNSGQVYVTDFGFAQLLNTNDTGSRTHGGTPAYMAPEQFQADCEPHPTIDVYGIGAILFSLLTGRTPHEAELQPGVPSDVKQIYLRCLAKVPAERFQHAGDVADALEKTISGLG